jgi:hypothetical protein
MSGPDRPREAEVGERVPADETFLGYAFSVPKSRSPASPIPGTISERRSGLIDRLVASLG